MATPLDTKPEAPKAPLPSPVVISSDMPVEYRKVIFDATKEAIQTHKIEKDQAMHVKRALEAWNGALWHVIIGTAFGASVAHEKNSFMLFKMGKVYVLCFQSFDESTLISGKKDAAFVPRAVQKKGNEDEEEGAAE